MWIFFECGEKRYAIRPYLGGVNGISGETSISNMTSLMRRMNSIAPRQDYIILPEQKWLDGIATQPGIVKQFVATQMVSSKKASQLDGSRKPGMSHRYTHESSSSFDTPQIGASVEWQMTGIDSVGGIQLQFIPAHNISQMSFSNFKDWIYVNDQGRSYIPNELQEAHVYDVLKTPREIDLQIGDHLHVKNLKECAKSRYKLVADLVAESPVAISETDTIDLEVCYADISETTLRVRISGSSRPPLSLKVNLFMYTHYKCFSLIMISQIESDDNFEDVLATIKRKLSEFKSGYENSGLHVDALISNAPDVLIPIMSWNQYNYFGNIQLNQISSSGGGKMQETCPQADFVWVSSIFMILQIH
jgi:hypothetical protein